MSYEHQDWETVVVSKHDHRPKVTGANEAAKAKRAGADVETHKKLATGNARGKGPLKDARKLDEEDENFAVARVEFSLKQKIQKARQAKGWSQKELAQAINEKASVINEYEAGKAIPNQQVLSKMERALGAKLRGGKK
uniref:HTH cro/C1-type domain-containing protein n=1 Tax=Palpitomonas bilix TaxID=652834 RepID=A0A7S3GJJ8_9EUKA